MLAQQASFHLLDLGDGLCTDLIPKIYHITLDMSVYVIFLALDT